MVCYLEIVFNLWYAFLIHFCECLNSHSRSVVVNLLKISLVLIAVMFAISLTFAIVGLVTFDLSVHEIKNILAVRNEGFAVNMVEDLEDHIDKRVSDFEDLTNLNLIHSALINSNEEFKNIPDIKSYLDVREKEIEFNQSSPFIGSKVDESLVAEFLDTIEFYHDEYNFDVVEELFVTNAYGANVALGSGTSDYSQSDEEWWQITKETGRYVGKIRYNEDYQSYSIEFAFRVDDVDGNFLGVLRVLISLNDLLRDLVEDSDLLATSGRNPLILDENGNSFFSNNKIIFSDSPVPYFSKIQSGVDSGFFELVDSTDDFLLISYAKSLKYESFEGFKWTVVIEQNQSPIVAESIDLRNSILIASILGMIATVIGSLLISSTVSLPLKRLTNSAESISRGEFDIHPVKSKIDEIQKINDSFEKMILSLKRLIETEKNLAEMHVKIKNERLSAIGELAASMAHDMKNPLATIKSSAEILQKKSLEDEETKEIINRMNRAIDRMSHQINDVLNYVRITPLKIRTVKISNLLQTAKNSLNIPDNITILIPGSEIEIDCDVEKLEIVFINIFLNSIQAIGNESGTIECKISKKNSKTEIVIQDSGQGIPENIFSKIFDPLVSSKQMGTGLGLSSTKHVIEQHNGSISAQNNPTRFTIILPISSQ